MHSRLFMLAACAAAFGAGGAAAGIPESSPFLDSCEAQGRRLWGRSLCAPVVAVNPATGTYRTSRAAPAVPFPPLRANTAFRWGEETWIMVLEPLPADPAEMAALLFHEAWHAQQEALGYPPNNAVAAHLDSAMDRYWMRLEWSALSAALTTRGARQAGHVAQALAFRRQRLAGKGPALTAERQLMRHEGLAAYTGVALSGDPVRLALQALRAGPTQPAFARSFAYASGPAWGLLLDRYRPDWRRIGGSLDLPEMMPVRVAAIARPDDYGATTVLSEEMLAGIERERRMTAALAATAPGRALRLPLAQIGLDYDPNRVSATPDGSTIYHRITLRDRWGRIRLEGIGIRISSDYAVAFAPWPLPEGALELAPGWRVEEQPQGGAVLVPPAR